MQEFYFPPLLVRFPIPVAGAFGFSAFSFFGLFSVAGLSEVVPFGRPRPFFSPLVAAAGLSAFSFLVLGSAFPFFAALAAPFGLLFAFLTPSPSPSASSSALRFSPFLALLGASSVVVSSLFSASSLSPDFFSSTFSSLWFFTTSLPGRARWMAGSLGWAALLIVLPRFDWTETSPSVFFSATSPAGVLPFQFQEAVSDMLVFIYL